MPSKGSGVEIHSLPSSPKRLRTLTKLPQGHDRLQTAGGAGQHLAQATNGHFWPEPVLKGGRKFKVLRAPLVLQQAKIRTLAVTRNLDWAAAQYGETIDNVDARTMARGHLLLEEALLTLDGILTRICGGGMRITLVLP